MKAAREAADTYLLLLIFLNLLFIFLGLITLKWIPLVSFLCGVFMILIGSYMAMDFSITLNYVYDTTSEVWVENIIDLPYSPYPQMFMILCGIILMLGFSVEISGE